MSESQVYIVNVWRSSGVTPEFRATARAVENLEPRFFTSVVELGRYLAEAAAATEPDRHSDSQSSSGDSPPHQQRTSP
jgi:hypothetical protein